MISVWPRQSSSIRSVFCITAAHSASSKPRGGAFAVPIAGGQRVVMERQAIEDLFAAKRLHQDFGPAIVEIARPAGDGERPGAAVLFHKSRVAKHQIGVILGRHVAAAAPRFVADAPVADAPRLVAAVRAALVGERAAIGVHVLDPLGQFGRRAAADVAGDHGLAAEPSRTGRGIRACRIGWSPAHCPTRRWCGAAACRAARCRRANDSCRQSSRRASGDWGS